MYIYIYKMHIKELNIPINVYDENYLHIIL